MTFGEAIIKLRSERRISQRQLAEELNVSFTSVNRWENGRTMPNKMTVFVIRKYCEEHGLDFFMTRGPAHESPNDDSANLRCGRIAAL